MSLLRGAYAFIRYKYNIYETCTAVICFHNLPPTFSMHFLSFFSNILFLLFLIGLHQQRTTLADKHAKVDYRGIAIN